MLDPYFKTRIENACREGIVFDEESGVFQFTNDIPIAEFPLIQTHEEYEYAVDHLASLAPVVFRDTWRKTGMKLSNTHSRLRDLVYFYNDFASLGMHERIVSYGLENMGVIFGSALAISWCEHFIEQFEGSVSTSSGSWLLENYYFNGIIYRKSWFPAVPVPWFREYWCEEPSYVTAMLDQLAVIYPGKSLCERHRVQARDASAFSYYE